jgi:hypothetical protein
VQKLANLGILLGLDSFVNVHFGITLPGTFIDKKFRAGSSYISIKPIRDLGQTEHQEGNGLFRNTVFLLTSNKDYVLYLPMMC